MSIDINQFDLELPALLSPGSSVLNSLGIDIDVSIIGIHYETIAASSVAAGPIGDCIELGQAIAMALGWDGVGNPLADLFS